MPRLYFDRELNTVWLDADVPALYSRAEGQTFDAVFYLLTPSTFASLFRQVAEADDAWSAGKMDGDAHRAMCERWAVIDAWARRHIDAVAIDDALARQRRLGRLLPLPKPPPRPDASSPWLPATSGHFSDRRG